jgi:hypothetical protein
LPGLEKLPLYGSSDWKRCNSVTIYNNKIKQRELYPKLPYFSGRLSFRESEYTISAAIQAISSDDSLEWSLLTEVIA